MKKDTIGHDIAQCLAGINGHAASISDISKSLGVSPGYVSAAVRDMKHNEQTVDVEEEMISLTSAGLDKLKELQ